GGALTVPALLLALPLVLSTGNLTLKPTGKIIGKQLVEHRSATSGPLFAVYDPEGEIMPNARTLWGTYALVTQLGKGSFYVGWVPVLLGLWWYRRRFRSQPGAWMLMLICLAVGYALWRVGVVVGYLSDR